MMYHFLLVVCSYNVSIFHFFRIRDITALTTYLTACDLEKFFVFDKAVKITSQVHFMVHV